MSLTVFRRYMYDDVALLSSTDPAANAWRLEVNGGETPGWALVTAAISDSHLNWSTPDLTLWDVLRAGEPSAIQKVFPKAGPSVPAGAPFAVTWDVSDWYPWTGTIFGHEHRFRFTEPGGTVFEFQLRSLLGGREHVFG